MSSSSSPLVDGGVIKVAAGRFRFSGVWISVMSCSDSVDCAVRFPEDLNSVDSTQTASIPFDDKTDAIRARREPRIVCSFTVSGGI
jgi:hypothetical protein